MSETPRPQAPLVHLNGSGKERLMEQLGKVYEAGTALMQALREASMNGRDYYPLGPDAFRRADDEHRARLRKVDEILAEVEDIMIQIDEQPGR